MDDTIGLVMYAFTHRHIENIDRESHNTSKMKKKQTKERDRERGTEKKQEKTKLCKFFNWHCDHDRQLRTTNIVSISLIRLCCLCA